MKRRGYVIELIADMDNLRLAFFKAAKGRKDKTEVIAFYRKLDINLLAIQSWILNGQIPLFNYNQFQVFDPKERTISAAPFAHRILHHAIINVCEVDFEKKYIYHLYACRKGKGTHKAIHSAQKHAKPDLWYSKMDVRKYFDTIDHRVLINILSLMYKDERLLLLFWQIIRSYEASDYKGIPIGNLTSQYFGNIYLASLDHFVLTKLRPLYYARYMDDIILYTDSKEQTNNHTQSINEFCNSKLNLVLKPSIIHKINYGMPYLGYKIYPDKVLLNTKSKKRFVLKYKLYTEKFIHGQWTEQQYSQHILPLSAFITHANAKAFGRYWANIVEAPIG